MTKVMVAFHNFANAPKNRCVNPLKTGVRLNYLHTKVQFPPHRKHNLCSSRKSNGFVVQEKDGVYCEKHMERVTTPYTKRRLLDIMQDGACTYHRAAEG